MIDNYDSFTYNLVQYLTALGQHVEVYHNDAIDVAMIAQLSPDYLVISPGPCTPNEAGISLQAIQAFAGKIPILGVCLGHQAIGQAFGAKVVAAKHIMHGRVSPIYHQGQNILTNLPSPFNATRYHSLVLDAPTLPDCFAISAWTTTQDTTKPDNHATQTTHDNQIEEIMGIYHKTYAIASIQFHPESILTEHGQQLLANFIAKYA